MKKRAQTVFGMSFGFIFSVILIISIISVAIYVITYFMSLGACSEVGIFYSDLQDEIDNAWTSGIYSGTFGENSRLPSKIDKVCFGELNSSVVDSSSLSTRDEIIDYLLDSNGNIFMHPGNKACDGSLSENILKNVEIAEFFCVEASDRKISVRLTKGAGSQLVRLTKQ